MRFFILKTLTHLLEEYCFLDEFPEDIGDLDCDLMFGKSVANSFPNPARMYADKTLPGIKTPSLVSNSKSLLILSKTLKDEVASLVTDAIEFLPLNIHNHKNRVASDEHFIVNPLGGFDCMDLELSEIEYFSEDPTKIVGIDKYVFDPIKLEKAPHLFRIEQRKNEFVISETLFLEWKALQPRPTNVFLEEVEQSPLPESHIDPAQKA